MQTAGLKQELMTSLQVHTADFTERERRCTAQWSGPPKASVDAADGLQETLCNAREHIDQFEAQTHNLKQHLQEQQTSLTVCAVARWVLPVPLQTVFLVRALCAVG